MRFGRSGKVEAAVSDSDMPFWKMSKQMLIGLMTTAGTPGSFSNRGLHNPHARIERSVRDALHTLAACGRPFGAEFEVGSAIARASMTFESYASKLKIFERGP